MSQVGAIEIQDPREDKAKTISSLWESMNNARSRWLEDTADVRRYVSAKSTSDTEVGGLPWKNKTTIPKLAQIADNLQSYYMAALMPTDDWFKFEGVDEDSHRKANIVEAYMKTKLRMGKFRQELEKMVRDWIIYGNTYGTVVWENITTKSLVTGEDIVNYIGPKLKRLSPTDVVVDFKAESFAKSPLILRKFYPLAEFVDMYGESSPEVTKKMIAMRGSGKTDSDMVDWYRQEMFRIDGFEDYDEYLNSSFVEVLEFWGDLYVRESGEILKNRKIIVADRSFTVLDKENPSWSGQKPFAHTGWRILPDTLLGQGPLDNLVGMQYRCDHLENLKADAFDQVIHPMIKVKGDSVEEFEFGPGQKIRCGADGDVDFLRPDASVLAANNEIAQYHQLMEMMAGSPKESMGFRSAGEKTAFEVNVLQQGADRMFQDKLNHFEEHIIEPILSLMFEMLMRNLDVADIARTFNDDTGAMEIAQLQKEDVVADGVLRPVGAKHFAARNKRVQELQGVNILLQNPKTANHISGLAIAKAYQEELGFERYGIVDPNVGVREDIMAQVEAQQFMQSLQQMGGGLGGNQTGEKPMGQQGLGQGQLA